jgi:hypothetical protein
MASFAVGVTITAGQPSGVKGYRPNSVTAAQLDTITADVGVLVADGATPTQGHVTTLDTDWTAAVAGKDAASDDVVLVVNAANVVTRTALRRAVAALLAHFEGHGALTP